MSKRKTPLPGNVVQLRAPADMDKPPLRLTRRGKVAVAVGTAVTAVALVAAAKLSHPNDAPSELHNDTNPATSVEHNLNQTENLMQHEAQMDSDQGK